MTKLCARGKSAAKRKFKVYPSAYANAYASKICAGKIKDPSGVKRKDFKGPKRAMGGMIKRATYMGGGLTEATQRLRRQGLKKGGGVDTGKEGERRSRIATVLSRYTAKTRGPKRTKKMGGGMMRPMYETGGKVARGCGAIMSNRSKKTKTF